LLRYDKINAASGGTLKLVISLFLLLKVAFYSPPAEDLCATLATTMAPGEGTFPFMGGDLIVISTFTHRRERLTSWNKGGGLVHAWGVEVNGKISSQNLRWMILDRPNYILSEYYNS
jgi:hypothetical protein